jgi:hypothetical protein
MEAARQATAGAIDVMCPERRDGVLRYEWIPYSEGAVGEGEYRIWCPECGAQNLVRISGSAAG